MVGCTLAFIRAIAHLGAERNGLSEERTTRGHFIRRLPRVLLARRQSPTGGIEVRQEGSARSGPTPHAGGHARLCEKLSLIHI
eukprot:10458522-Alexandrium_andersonii.AAC.1